MNDVFGGRKVSRYIRNERRLLRNYEKKGSFKEDVVVDFAPISQYFNEWLSSAKKSNRALLALFDIDRTVLAPAAEAWSEYRSGKCSNAIKQRTVVTCGDAIATIKQLSVTLKAGYGEVHFLTARAVEDEKFTEDQLQMNWEGSFDIPVDCTGNPHLKGARAVELMEAYNATHSNPITDVLFVDDLQENLDIVNAAVCKKFKTEQMITEWNVRLFRFNWDEAKRSSECISQQLQNFEMVTDPSGRFGQARVAPSVFGCLDETLCS